MGDANQLPTRMQTIRARAREHQQELESLRWFTPQRLADRWNVAVETVLLIPIERLRYKEFGAGQKLKRRRYKPEWVDAFEAAEDPPREASA